MSSYELANVEDRAARYWRTFRIPPREERESLKVGDRAMLIFDNKERMRVAVTTVKDGSYVGLLASHPVSVDLKHGDRVVFGPEHVLDVETGEETKP
jgi:hypothetical protein